MALAVTQTLDLKGLSCPLPILRTAKAMLQMEPGERVEVLATDPGSVPDLNAWCAKTGNPLVEATKADGVFRFVVEKARR
jgi:tRNA 2-thiouridine synthesizing protein A